MTDNALFFTHIREAIRIFRGTDAKPQSVVVPAVIVPAVFPTDSTGGLSSKDFDWNAARPATEDH